MRRFAAVGALALMAAAIFWLAASHDVERHAPEAAATKPSPTGGSSVSAASGGHSSHREPIDTASEEEDAGLRQPLASLQITPCTSEVAPLDLLRVGEENPYDWRGAWSSLGSCPTQQETCRFDDLEPGAYQLVQGAQVKTLWLNARGARRPRRHLDIEMPCSYDCAAAITVRPSQSCGTEGSAMLRRESATVRADPIQSFHWTDGEPTVLSSLPCVPLVVDIASNECDDVFRLYNDGSRTLQHREYQLQPKSWALLHVRSAESGAPIPGLQVVGTAPDQRHMTTDAAGEVEIRTDRVGGIGVFGSGWMGKWVFPGRGTTDDIDVALEPARPVEVFCDTTDGACPGSTLVRSWAGSHGWHSPCRWSRPGVWTCEAIDGAEIEATLDDQSSTAIVPDGKTSVRLHIKDADRVVCVSFDQGLTPCDLYITMASETTITRDYQGEELAVGDGSPSVVPSTLVCDQAARVAVQDLRVHQPDEPCDHSGVFTDMASVCPPEVGRAGDVACQLHRADGPPPSRVRLTRCPTFVPAGRWLLDCRDAPSTELTIEPGVDVDL